MSPALAVLLQRLVQRGDAERLDAWGAALALWSFGALQYYDEAVLSALGRAARGPLLRDFRPIDCACALVGWAALRARTPEQREFVDDLLARSLEALAAAPGDWAPQELANAVWALSKIGAAGAHRRALLDALVETVEWRLDDFNVQELTTLVYAYARLHHRVPAALGRIAGKVARHLDLVQPQDASMLMWGFAKLAFKPGPLLLDRLPLGLVGRLHAFRPQVGRRARVERAGVGEARGRPAFGSGR